MNIKKYYLAARNTWDETLAYRLNFVMWRVRMVLTLLTMYFLWSALLLPGGNILGYTREFMLTYILGTSIINSLVISNRSYEVGEEINNGNLSNFLLRPINYFLYQFSRDLGDKAMNIVFSFVELTILFIILAPPIFIQTDSSLLALTFFSCLLALTMYFFLNFLLGLIGFWSPDVWAPRFVFITVLTFFSGGLFPLDILPKPIFSILEFFPFPYLLFFPLKIYLGQLVMAEIIKGIMISSTWIFVLWFIVKFAWARGLRLYTAYGR
ncbi:MAG: hypothetical protein A3C30_02100 [Candidatus Levybacteria bacterium RIFCSPHIGHO2_02_FULL_40_18]|nr:MAG: hypothetical protein A2869_04480 [Candidatus Levybacteria bacterium RIFCSPHIGHO2_01_FULL_40_58]OGH26782.1 MAG: hypothetical protein A3C30_02100 [Candidatus Levybacteria bacterium RIFCSPHIGHO2_02_FULL_40_18]OGH31717.1 MAG: hypothetical protein A3E43_01820 [Candidatus Levybacteria bacterium RIFCSPHIGHO2_12_FULL_40_31]OGH40617.1 MAG: hypothetical protein A2894_00370 [Candidatus Levybacteria bacterium RIFCSPLOWO2_01_FULL_40_64]OGH48789.1 MAG: hypothetical protein A3I54_03995 [Candidatus Lev